MKKIYTLAVIASLSVIPTLAADEQYSWVHLGTGQYRASAMAEFMGASAEFTDVEVYEAAGVAGMYKVTGVWPDLVSDGELIVDATDPGFVMIPSQQTSVVDPADGVINIANDLWFYTVEYEWPKESAVEALKGIVATNVDNVITFPEGSMLLQWPKASSSGANHRDPSGWYPAKSGGVLVLPGGVYQEPWIDLGQGLFDEHIVSDIFSPEPYIDSYNVTVMQKRANPGIYQVIDPWHGLYESLGSSATSPTIELDATDPDNVLMTRANLGLNGGSELGDLSISSYSWYMHTYGGGAANTPEANRITLETEEETGDNGVTYEVRTFTFPYRSTFYYGAANNKSYYASPYASTLTVRTVTGTTAIEEIGTENEPDVDAPATYYNLQGIRVTHPAPGQLLIKRQGTTSTLIRIPR